jgi:integrase/recombinase XerD
MKSQYEESSSMVKLRLRYVIEDVDRHGNVRLYFRRRGQPKIRLTGLPGTEEFMSAYKAAMANNGEAPRQTRSVARGSFRYVCQAYFASPSFKALDPKTRKWRRSVLESICAKHADKPVALMQPKHVRALRDERIDAPGAANIRLKALRALFRWAVEADEAPHDPTRDVRKVHYRTTGFHSWNIEEVEAYEKKHPVGTKARLAMPYCSTRRAVVRMPFALDHSIYAMVAYNTFRRRTSIAVRCPLISPYMPTLRPSLTLRRRAI